MINRKLALAAPWTVTPLAALMVCALSGCIQAQAAPAVQRGWYCAGGDAQGSRHSPHAGPRTNHLKWICALEQSGSLNQVVVDRDGTVYASSIAWDPASVDGGEMGRSTLYAVGPDGKLAWKYGGVGEPVSLGADGTVYAAYYDNKTHTSGLTALSAEGKKRWSTAGLDALDDGGFSSSVIGPDGTIFLMAYLLHAVSPEGKLKWSFDDGNSHGISGPVVGPSGTIYYASTTAVQDVFPEAEHFIHAVGPDGRQRWSYKSTGEYQPGGLLVSAGDYLTCDMGGLCMLNAQGEEQFTLAQPFGMLAEGSDGAIYGATWDRLVALTAESRLLSYPIKGIESLIMGGDETLYFMTNDGTLTAMLPDGTVQWEAATAGEFWAKESLAIGGDGTLYVGGSDGKLYAFGE